MRHHIIVKWNSKEKAEPHVYQGIFKLFQEVIDRPNRYDLMICIDMDREALDRFDASVVHARWKEEYGGFIEQKTIFDCD